VVEVDPLDRARAELVVGRRVLDILLVLPGGRPLQHPVELAAEVLLGGRVVPFLDLL
jgi:hypothetical protein